MQAVGGHQQRAFGFAAAAIACLDQRRDALLVRAVAGHPMAQPYRVGPQAFAHGAVQHHLQLPAMHRILRPPVAGQQAARLGVHVVAVAADQGPLARLDADRVEHRVVETQVVQLAHRIGLQVDAHPQRLQVGHRLVDHAGHADLVQREGQGHAPDATAGDQHGARRR